MTTRARLDDIACDFSRFFDLIWMPGDVREVRIPKYNKYGHTASGYFDNPEVLARVTARWDGRTNLYFTLNPVNPALMARVGVRVVLPLTEITEGTRLAYIERPDDVLIELVQRP